MQIECYAQRLLYPFRTTLPLFRSLMSEPDIVNGDYSIHWLERHLKAKEAPPPQS